MRNKICYAGAQVDLMSNSTAGRGSCSLAVGTAPLGEAAGSPLTLRVAGRPEPLEGLPLSGVSPRSRAFLKHHGAEVSCQQQEEAILRQVSGGHPSQKEGNTKALVRPGNEHMSTDS